MERLRHIREQAGYSQQELADESGVSQHTISEIELGRRKPQGRTLRKLAKVLGVEVRDFFGELDSPLGQAPPERDYGAILEEMGFPPEQIEAWRAHNERGEEFIRHNLENMSAKDFLEERLRTSRYLRKYYREAQQDEAPPSSTRAAAEALDRTKMLKTRAMEVKHFTDKWREQLKNPNGQNVWWCSGVQALAHGLDDMARGLGYTQPREGEPQEERAARTELLRALEDMHGAADEVLEAADTADEAYSAKEEAERRRQAFNVIQGSETA